MTTSLLGRSYVSRARVSGETVLAYVDESGNPGVYPKGSSSYVLACLMINARDWPKALDGMIGFRRWVRARFGVPMRAEIKANYLIRNSGPFRDLALSETARRTIYRQAMRMPAKIEARVFGMVIRKMELEAIRPGVSPRDVAWEYLLQRLERVMTTEDATLLLIHDEGDEARVRMLARRARRAGTAGSAFGTGMLRVPARMLIDDPVPRDSRHSYFLQSADLAAYAAYRHLYPPPPRAVPMVPQTMWLELGAATYAAANSLRGGPPGLPSYPPAATTSGKTPAAGTAGV